VRGAGGSLAPFTKDRDDASNRCAALLRRPAARACRGRSAFAADALHDARGCIARRARRSALGCRDDATLRARYTAAKLKQDYEALPAKLGKAVGRGRPHTAEMGGHPVVMTPLIFERGLLTAEVRCDGAGAVSDFRLETTQVMGTP